MHYSFEQELLEVARHVVWFEEPSKTLVDTVFFLSYLMTYGTIEDIHVARKYYSKTAFQEALEHAPAGVFDPRSWAYWNIMFDHIPVPPLPKRFSKTNTL